ncbi:MAG: ElyC/SanA/YdcF family protein [Bacteroidales bacterium]
MNTSIFNLLRRFSIPLIRILILSVLLVLTVMLFSNLKIRHASLQYLYDSEQVVPGNRVGLVLGTAPFLRKDVANPYFQHRMDAAAKLYHAGKVEYLIVSGDNRTRWYNEPEQMRRHLVALGVPDSVIYLDYAGLRTLDSVVRANEVFGQQQFTIISQEFHNQRAVYLARYKGLRAIGFNAADVSAGQNLKTQVREWFARVKVFYDLLIHKRPRHLGDPVMVGASTR